MGAMSDLLNAVYRGDTEGRDAILAERAPADVFEAAAVGDVARLGALLDADASALDAVAKDGFTPLHLASFFGHADAVRALLARGAALEVVAENPMRVRPLHSAAASGDTEVVRLLVGAGAEVDARQEGGFVPLHAVAQNGDADGVDLLLAAGADVSAATDDGRTAADLALAAGHRNLAARLSKAASG